MIARVAEHCFWLQRYLERTENTARLLQVNLTFLLDTAMPADRRWRPVLQATGEEDGFLARFGTDQADDGEAVQGYMCWDVRNPVSLVTSLHFTRENARTIRETVSLEMWSSVNAFWIWLDGGAGRRLFDRDRHAFYEQVKEYCQLIQGQFHTTMLFDRPYDFMRLGSLLERSDQTARLLAAMVDRAAPSSEGDRGGISTAGWLAILRSCSAVESYAKRTQAPLSARSVVGFLLQEPAFPRAVRHCLEGARAVLASLWSAGEEPPHGSIALLDGLLGGLGARTPYELPPDGVAAEVSRLLTGTALVTDQIRQEFFASPPVLAGEVT
jgi:uncharacterized alpha-E superfamily protein